MKLKKLFGGRIYDVVSKQLITRSIRKTIDFTQKSDRSFTAQSAVGFLFSDTAKYVRPWQHVEEIAQLAGVIEGKKPKVVLEIGTASGGTLFLAACLAAPDALLVSIDLPHGLYGGGYPDWKIPLYKGFAQKDQSIELLQGDSHSQNMFLQLTRILGDKKIDYLFIDGDHTYEGVKQDFEMYGKLLAPGAIVAFHDIVSDKSEKPDHFVSVFWNEIKNKYRFQEFVKDKNQSKLGLGVLEVS